MSARYKVGTVAKVALNDDPTSRLALCFAHDSWYVMVAGGFSSWRAESLATIEPMVLFRCTLEDAAAAEGLLSGAQSPGPYTPQARARQSLAMRLRDAIQSFAPLALEIPDNLCVVVEDVGGRRFIRDDQQAHCRWTDFPQPIGRPARRYDENYISDVAVRVLSEGIR